MIVLTVEQLLNSGEFIGVSTPQSDREVDGIYIGDLLSWVMGKATSDCAWITIMSNINIVAVASLIDVSCIILAEGVNISEYIVNTAQQKGVNILRSDKTAYQIAVLLNGLL